MSIIRTKQQQKQEGKKARKLNLSGSCAVPTQIRGILCFKSCRASKAIINKLKTSTTDYQYKVKKVAVDIPR